MSSVNFNVLAGFRAVHRWQQNLVRNAQGLLQPGFNRTNLHFGSAGSVGAGAGQVPTSDTGSRAPFGGGGDTLAITGQSLHFEQGDIMPANSPTSLAIKGEGFFILAENLKPGARLFLSRNGDFRFDAQGRLVNSQGLFVVGGGGDLTDPPTPITDRRGDGTVTLPDITLARVGAASNLALSGYGPLIYEANAASGAIRPFANGRPEVGFVQTSALEFPTRAGFMTELQAESTQAAQTYKMFKDLLENYNRATDDALGTIR